MIEQKADRVDLITLNEQKVGRDETDQIRTELQDLLSQVRDHKCTEFGLNAVENDAIAYLREQKPNGFEVVTGFHLDYAAIAIKA